MKRNILIAFVAIFALGTLSVQSQIRSNRQEKRDVKDVIAEMEAVTLLDITIGNSQGTPLLIQEARVKEISGDDFRRLTGEAPGHFRQSTFPEVVLYNASSKMIKSFAIAVENGSGKVNGLLKNISIPPYSNHKVLSIEWPRAEHITIEKEGKFVNAMRQPGLDSAKSWVPGAASDLKVTIGFVEFEDGTKWTLPSDNIRN